MSACLLLGWGVLYAGPTAGDPQASRATIGRPSAAVVIEPEPRLGTFDSGRTLRIGGRSVSLLRARGMIAVRLRDAKSYEPVNRPGFSGELAT